MRHSFREKLGGPFFPKLTRIFTLNLDRWFQDDPQNHLAVCLWLTVMWRKAGTQCPRGSTWGDFLSWFPAAVGPLFPDGYHQRFVHSSSCTGQSCRSGASLLPRLEPGVGRHGQPFRTVDQNWDGDTETLVAQTSVDTWLDIREKENRAYEETLVLACSCISSPLGLTVNILFSGTPTSL